MPKTGNSRFPNTQVHTVSAVPDWYLLFLLKSFLKWCTWLAQPEEHMTLDLGILSLSPM